MKKQTFRVILMITVLMGITVWFCYPIFPWEDTYSEYLLGDMKPLVTSPYKEKFEENQDILKYETNDENYKFVYLLANGKDIYFITESPEGMGKELYNLNGSVAATLYDGSYNTLFGVKIINNKLYYVYGNLHGRQAIGNFVKDAATSEINGKRQLWSTVLILKPKFAFYDLSSNQVIQINKSQYIEAVNEKHNED